ncbi:MAG: MerR family transcriptional regulator [Thermodesulfobacteriota bacterium]
MENGQPPSTHIPDKLYFKIGEVTAITGLASYVLRFWESEFKAINPKRTDSGQRLYRKGDIETILKIKDLLYEKKFTIQGAKKHLKTFRTPRTDVACGISIDEITTELKAIRQLLEEP